MMLLTFAAAIVFTIDSSCAVPAHSRKELLDSIRQLNVDLIEANNVQAYLRFAGNMSDQVVKTGGELELRCEAVGAPSPLIYWTHNGRIVAGSETDSTIYEKLRNLGKATIEEASTVSKLVIPCADKTHRGVYKCVAQNGHRVVERAVKVSVVGQSSKCKKDVEAAAPRITMYNDFRFENDFNAAQIFCRASKGSVIAWYDGDRRLIKMNDPKYEILPTGDLLIRKVDSEMMGVFTCVAVNEFGEDRADTFFYPTLLEDAPSSEGSNSVV